jgi:hypothetical protein
MLFANRLSTHTTFRMLFAFAQSSPNVAIVYLISGCTKSSQDSMAYAVKLAWKENLESNPFI